MDSAQGKKMEKDQVPHWATAPAVEQHADRDDMGDSYGTGYTTRSSDEGYGERYGEAVKKVLEKKAEREEHLQEMQRGVSADRDQSVGAEVHPEYDRSQGHPVAQKEDSRHFTNQDAL